MNDAQVVDRHYRETDTGITVPARTLRAHEMPSIGPRGQLTYRGHSVCLSERNALLVGVLVYHFGTAMSDLELLERVWPEGATRRTLWLHLRRLDRRLAPVGLTIVDSGYRSHALLPVESRWDRIAEGVDEQR